ncbi:MAG: DUF285 domain-containing protein [Proteobacteria bacterium]|nr:DUF285 domain-containing protein [Pseudomonadota bacterium]
MKYTIVLGIAVLSTMSFVAGCSRNAANQAPEKQGETAQNEVSQQNPERASSDLPVQEEEGQEANNIVECANGARLQKGKCVCEDGTEWLGEGWYCILGGQRCYHNNGCNSEGNNYSFGTAYKNNRFERKFSRWSSLYKDAVSKNYICRDNQWIPVQVRRNRDDEAWMPTEEFMDKLYSRNEYCGGIDEESLGNSDWFEECLLRNRPCAKDPYHYRDYRCRYNHWVCVDEIGCKCFDGNETKHIQQFDICENKVCKEALPDNLRSHLYSSWTLYNGVAMEYGDEPDLCLEGNCPCGDGTCMKFGICKDGVCSCEQIKSNQHGEFYCNRYNAVISADDSFGSQFEIGGILTCHKDGGCHTRDGRHYPKGALIGFNGYSIPQYSYIDQQKYWKDLAYRDSLMFHVDGGLDTTIESISPLGECVLDRTDSMRRWTEIQNDIPTPSEYICDKSECRCDKTTCRFGELCRSGECAADKCEAHDVSRPICNVDLFDGHQSFEYPEKPGWCVDPEQLDVKSYDIYFGRTMAGAHHAGKERDENVHDSDDLEFKHSGKTYYDVIECKGGHRYCHGKNNEPIKISDKPDGWKCLAVNSLPGSEGKSELKTWICDKKSGCVCGDSRCGYMKSCIDGQCVDVNLPYEECSGKRDGWNISGNPENWKCMAVMVSSGKDNGKTKAWVCDHANGCICGDSQCKQFQACMDGQCADVSPAYCDGKPVEKGYKCISAQNGMEESFREIGMACIQNECSCGALHCPQNALCRNGRCLNHEKNPVIVPPDYRVKSVDYHYYGDNEPNPVVCGNSAGCKCNGENIKKGEKCSVPCYGDGRLDADGCWCGDRKLNDVQNETCLHYHEQYYVLCNDPKGCSCGDTKCPMSSYCSEGQCIDPLTEKPIAGAMDKLVLSLPCTDESCPCGETSCHTGEFCYGASCHKEVYANILHEQRYFYDERLVSRGDNLMDWNMIQSYDMSEFNPNHLPSDEYGFMPYYRYYDKDKENFEFDNIFVKGKLRCQLPSGCRCGEHVCAMGAECIDGECVYDNGYMAKYGSIGWSELSEHGDEIFSKGSDLYCYGTSILPAEPHWGCDSYGYCSYSLGYQCEEIGWKCEQESGCACGNVRCAANGYCIRPGVCTEYDSKDESSGSADDAEPNAAQVSEFENRKPFKYTISIEPGDSQRPNDIDIIVAINSVESKYPVKYDLDCEGDGNYEYIGLTDHHTCIYKPNSGNHQIWVRGNIPAMWLCPSFNDASQSAVLSIDDWGDISWKSMYQFAARCKKLNGIPKAPPNLSEVDDMSEMFERAESFNQPVDNWDVSNVKNMNRMFHIAKSFNQPVGNWDVSNVTDMREMFAYAESFNQPVEMWNVSKAEKLSGMFRFAESFNQPVEKWNISNAEYLDGMFYNASSFSHYPESWIVPKYGGGRDMFVKTKVYKLSQEKPLKTR